MTNDLIEISAAPAIPGVIFRRFRGTSDFPHMAAIMNACAEADQVERISTAEDLATAYTHLVHSDPSQDMIFAEINGDVVGFSHGWSVKEENGPHLYALTGFVTPAWRRKGIGVVMLRWMEEHLRAIANGHPAEHEKFFQGFTTQHEIGLATMFERQGYQPVRYGWEMVRPTLDNIPDFPIPAGLEVRPVLPEHYRAIWDTAIEAFRDDWGFAEIPDEHYWAWLENKALFQPHLWQIAWDVATNQIAGQVRTCIDHAQNEKYSRKRGFAEVISVGKPWRRRGLARALIALSLHAQKEQGMTESFLGVDSENVAGATRVYEDCGFRVIKQNTMYRKPL
jgi:GNAT superfamily N-acetyltransferase